MSQPSATSRPPAVSVKLDPMELDLIELLRDPRHKFGEVTVLMRDGLPYKITRTIEHTIVDSGKR